MKVLGGLKRMVILVLAAMLFLVGGVGNIGVASAAEVPDYRIQISPMVLDIELKPGETTEAKFKVQNTGNKTFDYQMGVRPFNVVDESYSQDVSTETKYNYITDWITFSEPSGTIEADHEVEMTLTVKVPKDVPAGGQYAMVTAALLEPGSDGEGSGVSAEVQVGMLVYSKNVEGETRQTGNIVENKVPSFMFAPPIHATSVVENTGNVHAEATYIMQVYPLFGGEEVYSNEESPEKRTILPETRRLNTMSWGGAPQLGIFKVKQTVKFSGEESVTEKVVFICPLWFLFIILAIIFLAIFWIVSRARGRKE